MDVRNIHFRSYVYTGFKLDKSALQLFEPPAPSLRTVKRWIGDIKKDTFTLDKNVSTGRPRPLRTSGLIREVEDLTEKDPRMSIWELDELVHVDQTSIKRILTEDLEMKNVQFGYLQSFPRRKRRIKLHAAGVFWRMLASVRMVSTVSRMNWSIVKSKQQNMTWIKKGGKRSHCQENDAADRIYLQPRKIFDHSIAQGCYGNCRVYGGIL